MRTAFLIIGACAVALGVAQRDRQPDPGAVKAKNEEINRQLEKLIKEGAGERDKFWAKSSLTLGQLAAKVANATKNPPPSTYGKYKMLAQTSEGRGIYEGEFRFQQRNVFKVNWVHIQADPRNGTLLSNGKTRQSFFDGKLGPSVDASRSFAGATTDPAQLVARFSNEFPRFLFQGATDGKDPWVPLLTAWSKGAGGYKVFIQERNITYQGRKFRNFRIKADRTVAGAKKLGKSSIEIIIDGNFFLPVTVREIREDLDKRQWVIQWAGSYNFNQKFKPDDFKMTGTAMKANP
jgi:hypothetical protein